MARFGIPDGTQPPVHIDAKTESLASGIRRAALQTIGRGGPTPMEAMQKEHGRLLKAFREAEGRDPDPNFDPEFWMAYSKIIKRRTGDEFAAVSEEEFTSFEKRISGDGWVEPEPGADLEEHIEKQIAAGRAPAWARGLMDRRKR